MKLLAQNLNFGTFKGFGPLGNPTGTGINTFNTFLSSVIGLMTLIAFIWFTFTLITGAIGIMNAGGDKAAIEAARKKITNGIVGVVIVISSIFILSLIGTIFGIPFLDIFQLFYRVAFGASGPLPAGIN